MVTESDSYGRVRGYIAQPAVAAPQPIGRAAIAQAIGTDGRITIVKDLRMRDLYEGVVPLQTGEVDKDLMYYLFKSEQVPSLVEIGAELDREGTLIAAGGLLVESMPDYDAAAFRSLADRLEDLPPLDKFFAHGDLPEQVLAHLFGPISYEILETRDLIFRCGCSRERSRRAVMLMGAEEIEALVLEGEAIVDCHFCHEQYVFDRDELRAMLAELSAADDQGE
jgi:molecular chaperone Hsp33